MVANHLAKYVHIVDTTTIQHYLIKLTLEFKGCHLHIYGLYYPPTDKPTQRQITNYIKKEHALSKRRDLHYTIILGDFNSIVDPILDRQGNTRHYRNPSALVVFLINNLYIDTYRFLHPTDRAYTWHTTRNLTNISTRIDHIWVSENWTHDITYTSIEEMEQVTQSDHNLITCMIHTGSTIRNFKISERRRRDKPRTVYDYKNTTASQWENYRNLSKDLFMADRLMKNLLNKPQPTQQDIDVIWKSFVTNTSKAATETIPHKQVNHRRPRKPRKLLDLRPSGLLAHANTLRKLSNNVHKFPLYSFTNVELLDINNSIDAINEDTKMDIPHLTITNFNQWPSLCRPYSKLIKKQIKIQALQAKDEAISKHLLSRAEDTNNH